MNHLKTHDAQHAKRLPSFVRILFNLRLINFNRMTTTVPKEEKVEAQILSGDDEKAISSSNTPTLHEATQEDIQTKPEVELPTEEEETQWVTGWKLMSLMIALTLAAFLMLLDMSIIATVCSSPTSNIYPTDID